MCAREWGNVRALWGNVRELWGMCARSGECTRRMGNGSVGWEI